MPGQFEFRVDDTDLVKYLRDQAGRWVKGSAAIAAANQQSIEWLGQRAREILDKEAVRRAPDDRNSTSLAEAVVSPEVSHADASGFQFLIHDRMIGRTAAYYRVIEGKPGQEFGSVYWVGRLIRLQFYGPGGFTGQAARPGTGFVPWIHIGRGVPAYHYAQQARDAFMQGRMWWKFAYAELDKVGINARVSARA